MDKKNLEIADTIVIDNLIKGMWDAIKSTDLSYLDTLTYLVSRRADTIGKNNIIPSAFLNTIFDHYKLDALISLDYYYITLTSTSPFNNYETGSVAREYGLRGEMLWRVYLKDQSKPFDEYRYSDTLYYVDNMDTEGKFQLHSSDVVRQGMYEMGYNYGLRHTLVWYEVARIIFRGGSPELAKAATYTDEGNWDEAVQIWFDMEDDIHTIQAAKACHNIAVYYELQDNLAMAYSYAKKALGLWDNDVISEYVQELSIRLKNNEDIIRQYR